jgi:hypothetical protein
MHVIAPPPFSLARVKPTTRAVDTYGQSEVAEYAAWWSLGWCCHLCCGFVSLPYPSPLYRARVDIMAGLPDLDQKLNLKE